MVINAVCTFMMSLRTLIAMITSSKQLPARSPIPFIAPSTWRAGVDRGEGVTDSDAQIVMGVDGMIAVDIRTRSYRPVMMLENSNGMV
jgi:hypothetical protein